MEKSASQLLQEARALIAQGWTQDEYFRFDKKGQKYCIAGALTRVCCRSFTRKKEIEWLISDLLYDWQRTRNYIWWNDQPSRTQAEVLALFDRALVEVTK